MAPQKPLIIASDEHFLFLAATTVRSLSLHFTPLSDLVVFAYFEGVSQEAADQFAAYCDELGVALRIVRDDDLPGRAVDALDAVQAAVPSRPRPQNARFVLPELMAGEFSRAVYTDVDIIAVAEMSGLWDLDLGGHPVGAVREHGLVTKRVPEVQRFMNSGVMLIDVDQWVQEELGYETIDRMIENAGWSTFDQDALNLVLAERDGSPRWRDLPIGWNAGTPAFFRDARREVDAARERGELRVVHFSGGLGPGMLRWHPFGDALLEHLAAVPFEPPQPYWQNRATWPLPRRYPAILEPAARVRRWIKRKRQERRRPKTLIPGPRRSRGSRAS